MAADRPSDVLRAYCATFVHGGVDAAARLWGPDIEWHPLAGPADDAAVVQGQAAMRRYYAEWVDTMDELRGDVREIAFEDGDVVVALIRNSGRGRASGVPASGEYYVACVVRDGRIVVGREYSTRAAAVAAAEALGTRRAT
jgi:ketosteroid isomerase-like protein